MLIDMNTESARAAVLDREGCRLHYWLAGPDERPLVVLTHGMALDHRMFDQQVAALAGDYRVLTWDLRGHGRSQSAGAPFTITRALGDLLAILDHIGVQRAAFVGHSLGGIIAQELAFRTPDRVSALADYSLAPLREYPRIFICCKSQNISGHCALVVSIRSRRFANALPNVRCGHP